MKFGAGNFYKKSVEKIQVWLKSDRNFEQFTSIWRSKYFYRYRLVHEIVIKALSSTEILSGCSDNGGGINIKRTRLFAMLPVLFTVVYIALRCIYTVGPTDIIGCRFEGCFWICCHN